MQHSSPSHHRLALLAAACGLAVLVAPAAHAFTIDQQSNTTSNGSARYSDPDERFSGSGSGQTIQQGNTTIRFGGQWQLVRPALRPKSVFQFGHPAGQRPLSRFRIFIADDTGAPSGALNFFLTFLMANLCAVTPSRISRDYTWRSIDLGGAHATEKIRSYRRGDCRIRFDRRPGGRGAL